MLRRFTTHAKPGNPTILPEDHPAVVEGRSRFQKPAGASRSTGKVLISGVNQRKIGGRVQKGAWKGFPIYTLTLEERKTCPRSCAEWRSCYGSHMHWPVRHQPGPALEAKIEAELTDLQTRHPAGFVVRLHILGDFYSVDYVLKWRLWLETFHGLMVWGYTARTDEIGDAVERTVQASHGRFSIRSSGGGVPSLAETIVVKKSKDAPEGSILCPAQVDKTACCATCALCWASEKIVAFLQH